MTRRLLFHASAFSVVFAWCVADAVPDVEAAQAGQRPLVFEAGGAPAPAPTADPNAPVRLAAALRAPFDQRSLVAAVEALARAGVATGANTDLHILQEVVPPASTYRYFEAQVRSMAFELATGGGYTGARLNVLVPPVAASEVPGGRIPFSAILAAYAARGETFGARLARALMGPIELPAHADLVYPRLVVALFLADVGPRHEAVAPAAVRPPWLLLARVAHRDPLPVVASLPGAASPVDACAAIDEFLNRLGDRVRDLLTPEGEGLLASIGAGVAAALGVAVDVVTGLLRRAVVDNPVLRAVRSALAVAAVLTQAASLLNPWTVRVTGAGAHYGIGSPGEGRFVATVLADVGWTWPQPVTSCAALLSVELPRLTDPSEADIVWTPGEGFGVHAFGGPETDALESRGTGYVDAYDYETETESAKAHARGKSGAGSATIAVRVRRPEIDRLKDFVFRALNLPMLASVAATSAVEWLKELSDPTGGGVAPITFHHSPEQEEEEQEEEKEEEEDDGAWIGTVSIRLEMRTRFGEREEKTTTVEASYSVSSAGGPVSSRGSFRETTTGRRAEGCPSSEFLEVSGEWNESSGHLSIERDRFEPGFTYQVEAGRGAATVPMRVRSWATPCPCDPDDRGPCQTERGIDHDPPAGVRFTVTREPGASVMTGRITRELGSPMPGLPMDLTGTEVITYSFRRVPRR